MIDLSRDFLIVGSPFYRVSSIGISKTFLKGFCEGFISLHLLEHSILVYRRFLSRELLIVGSLFYQVSLIDIQKTFYKGFISLHLLEHNILVYRHFCQESSWNVGSIFYIVSLIDIQKTFYKGFFLVFICWNTKYWFRGVFCRESYWISAVYSTELV